MSYDIAIIGGGLNGLLLAHLMTQAGQRTVLLEQGGIDHPSSQTIAINACMVQCLQIIGLWQQVEEIVYPYDQMRVTSSQGHVDFQVGIEEVQQPHLGYVVNVGQLKSILLAHLKAEVYEHTVCEGLTQKVDHVVIETAQQSLQAQLLLATDGFYSGVRKQLNIPVQTFDYQQQALTAIIQASGTEKHTIYQHFGYDGPMAWLPISDDQVALVWSASAAVMAPYLASQHWEQAIPQWLSMPLSAIKVLSEPKIRPLVAQYAKYYTDQRIALVGDAAHAIHPLAGQGANLGARDSLMLYQLITASQRLTPSLLKHYEAKTATYNRWVLEAMTCLLRCYQGQTLPVGLQNVALGVLESFPGLKRWLVQPALG